MRHNPGRGIMTKFVGKGRIIIVAGMEVGKLRHDDMIAARLIIRLRTMMAHRDRHAAKERIKFGVAVIGISGGDDRRGGGILRLDAVDLLGVENRVAFQECDLPLSFLSLCAALFSALAVAYNDLVGIDNGRSLLALADTAAQRERLLEGQPMRGSIALRHGGNPQGQDVDAAIGNAGRAQRDIGRGGPIP
jgi:hypothetical protein